MFPNPNNSPFPPAQFTGHQAIALAVAGDFGIPKFPVGFRSAITARTTMPKATINEDSQTRFPKKKIRLAEDFLLPAPASNAVPPEQLCQNDFCGLVSTAPDTGHDFGSFGLKQIDRAQLSGPCDAIVELSQRLDQLQTAWVPRSFHRAITSSRTKWRRMIPGACAGSS